MAESLNCVVYLLMKKPQELDGCPTSGAHFNTAIGGKPPPTVDCIPALVDCIPALVDCIPALADCIPALADCIPALVDCIPALADCIPALADCIPALVDCISALVDCISALVDQCPDAAGPAFAVNGGLASHTSSIKPMNIHPSNVK